MLVANQKTDTASMTNCLRCKRGFRMNFRVRIVTGAADMLPDKERWAMMLSDQG